MHHFLEKKRKAAVTAAVGSVVQAPCNTMDDRQTSRRQTQEHTSLSSKRFRRHEDDLWSGGVDVGKAGTYSTVLQSRTKLRKHCVLVCVWMEIQKATEKGTEPSNRSSETTSKRKSCGSHRQLSCNHNVAVVHFATGRGKTGALPPPPPLPRRTKLLAPEASKARQAGIAGTTSKTAWCADRRL